MIFYFTTYLFIGLCFSALMDKLSDINVEAESFTNLERLSMALLWPIGLIVFLYQLVVAYLK